MTHGQRFTLAAVVLLSASCAAPRPSDDRINQTPSQSEPPAATPSEPANASGEPPDFSERVECRRVPEDLCFDLAIGMAQGPRPEYAEGAGIERVIVTCEVDPPCGVGRLEAGGNIVILYTNGWAWTQRWSLGAGI